MVELINQVIVVWSHVINDSQFMYLLGIIDMKINILSMLNT